MPATYVADAVQLEQRNQIQTPQFLQPQTQLRHVNLPARHTRVYQVFYTRLPTSSKHRSKTL